MALGHFKRNEIDESEFYNSTCLDLDSKNVKAHYRVIQYHLARNELKEAQEYAIKCASKYKSEGESGTKSFKEILLGEIAERIREKVDKSTLEDELISHETKLRALV